MCVYKETYYKKSVHVLLQEGESLLGPESGLLSNTQKWIVQGDTCADEARDFIGKGTWAESNKVREPRRTAQSRVLYGDGISFWVVSDQSFGLRVLPGGAHIAVKMDASEKDSGTWLDTWCLLSTFPGLFQLLVVY